MVRRCFACGGRSVVTTPEWPALCTSCLDRIGEPIRPGACVICRVDDRCNGIVNRIKDDLAVVATNDGKEAWVPIPELVAITKH